MSPKSDARFADFLVEGCVEETCVRIGSEEVTERTAVVTSSMHIKTSIICCSPISTPFGSVSVIEGSYNYDRHILRPAVLHILEPSIATFTEWVGYIQAWVG